ncbi:MAG TPA: hypothetical protein ACFYEK_05320 [Candidatus Wunengus sp. YC60]|uniref:hypothetical protein n=1 Tax=Candidatus Wunengus sp. YC60 TaxID=3367697 RepID=UPI0040266D95
MNFSKSTDSERVIIQQTVAPVLIKHTEDQGPRSPYYNLYYDKTGTKLEPAHHKRAKALSDKERFQQIAISEKINRLLRKVSDTVVNLAAIEDTIEQTNLAFTFKHCLEELWENRDIREDNWGDLLNILQAVLVQVEFELLSGSQKSGIKKVVTEYLCKAEVTDSDMEDALGILSETGFDPWRGISGKPQD